MEFLHLHLPVLRLSVVTPKINVVTPLRNVWLIHVTNNADLPTDKTILAQSMVAQQSYPIGLIARVPRWPLNSDTVATVVKPTVTFRDITDSIVLVALQDLQINLMNVPTEITNVVFKQVAILSLVMEHVSTTAKHWRITNVHSIPLQELFQ